MFYPQGGLYPQSGFITQGFNPLTGAAQTPFANTLYGFPQQSPIQGFSPQSPIQQQYYPQYANWQQHPALLQAVLQQQALQQLIAHQLAAQQQQGLPNFPNGMAGQPLGAWSQQSGL